MQRDIQNYNFACFEYGCESWSLTLREVRRSRVFENRVLRRIFGPKRAEVIGECRKLPNEELNPYPTAFPYGNGMVLHFYQQQESSTTKLYTKSLTRDLKLMYSRLTLVRISIKLQAPCVLYIGTGVSLLFRERFLYI